MIGNRPWIYAGFRGVWMVHQKGHEKRAGEAGGKARFEGWRGQSPGGGPACGPAASRAILVPGQRAGAAWLGA